MQRHGDTENQSHTQNGQRLSVTRTSTPSDDMERSLASVSAPNTFEEGSRRSSKPEYNCSVQSRHPGDNTETDSECYSSDGGDNKSDYLPISTLLKIKNVGLTTWEARDANDECGDSATNSKNSKYHDVDSSVHETSHDGVGTDYYFTIPNTQNERDSIENMSDYVSSTEISNGTINLQNSCGLSTMNCKPISFDDYMDLSSDFQMDYRFDNVDHRSVADSTHDNFVFSAANLRCAIGNNLLNGSTGNMVGTHCGDLSTNGTTYIIRTTTSS